MIDNYDAFYLANHVPPSEVVEILAALCPEDRAEFSEQKALAYLRAYRKAKISLCIIILTANRHLDIDAWLSIVGERIESCGVDLVIYDSSSDNATEMVVQQYVNNGMYGGGVSYKRYTGIFDGISLDHKFLAALDEYSSLYDYVWPVRDGMLLEIDTFYIELLNLTRNNNDILILDNKGNDYINSGPKMYTDCTEFFKENIWRMTILGVTVYAGKFFKAVINEVPLDEKTNYGLWNPIAIFHYIACHKFTAALYFYDHFTVNPYATDNSFWNKNGRALWQWTERWFTMINSLPPVYDSVKPGILKIDFPMFHPFSDRALYVIKLNGCLRYRDIARYRYFISWVTNVPLWRFYLFASLPVRFLYYLDKICYFLRFFLFFVEKIPEFYKSLHNVYYWKK